MKIKALHLNTTMRLGAYASKLWQVATANQGIESIEHTDVSGGGFIVSTMGEGVKRVVFVSSSSVEYAEYDLSEPVPSVGRQGKVAAPPVS